MLICQPLKSLASSSGNFDCILILVEHGANINTINKNKNTPLHLAAINGHHQTVEQLIRAGSTLNNQNQSGNTPLIEAVLHGHERAVSVLIQAGADIMKKNNQKVIQSPYYLGGLFWWQKQVVTNMTFDLNEVKFSIQLSMWRQYRNSLESVRIFYLIWVVRCMSKLFRSPKVRFCLTITDFWGQKVPF